MKNLFSELPYLQGERVTLRPLGPEDAGGLAEMVNSPKVYRYLPTFLFEKKYEDVTDVISRLYDECLEDSLILGIFAEDQFCGLAEMYGYSEHIHKISIGYRALERCWGQGIATETIALMVRFLYDEKGIEIITASTMVENHAVANVLKKNGFDLVVHAVDEDWGYEKPTIADKWII